MECAQNDEGRLFTLNIDNRDHASPNLLFTWCLSPAAVEQLQKRGVKHPHLLVLVSEKTKAKNLEQYPPCDEHGDEEANESGSPESCPYCLEPQRQGDHTLRQLYPLHQGMGQILFNHPGDFEVSAQIIWDQLQERRGGILKKVLLEEAHFDGRTYSRKIGLKRDDDWITHFDRLEWHEEVSVHINDSLFAKPLPRGIMWWTNLLFEGRVRDQCTWRKRALWAFTIQPLLVACWIVLRSLCVVIGAVFMFLSGWRSIRFWSILAHPFDTDLEMIKDHVETYQIQGSEQRGYFHLYSSNGKRRPRWQKRLLLPWHWVIGLGVTWACYIYWSTLAPNARHQLVALVSWHGHTPLKAFVATLITIACGSLFLACVSLRQRLWSWYMAREKRQSVLEQEQAVSELTRYYREKVEPLSCKSSTPRPVGIEALPKTHRTLAVRFLDAKTKICKPFAIG